MMNILICDDEKDIAQALRIYLSEEKNYRIFMAYDGLEALEMVKEHEIHLILMDIMMPRMDGITAMQKIRQNSNVPVILLTAKSEDEDKVLGLDVGADDYITKPFNPGEVTARVKSQLRRYMTLGGTLKKSDSIRVGGLELDNRRKLIIVDGEEVALTRTEYDICALLMANPGKVFSTGDIYRKVWNENPIGVENTVAVHIRNLRKKLEIDSENPRYLKVVWGQGYMIEGRA